jgi:DNA-binding response OmpR family regulator
MNRVLIIEDESTLRGSMARGLEKLDDIQVLVAGTLDEGLAEIDSKGVDLILSDLDLPGRPGVELFGELAKRRLRVPIVFLSAYLEAYRSSLPPNGSYEVFEKPVSLNDLREIVIRKLEDQEGEGRETPFGVLDYLQLACLGRHSVIIFAKDQLGNEGKVIVHRGEIWHAKDSQGSGKEAFDRLIFATKGVRCSANRAEIPERTIQESWESLMINAAARMDEGQADAEERNLEILSQSQTETVSSELTIQETTHTKESEVEKVSFEELVDLGTEALLAKDYSSALLMFQEAERKLPGNGLVQANLQRLQAMGINVSQSQPETEEPT